MASQLEKIVKTYKSLAQVPAIVGAKLALRGDIVYSFWTQRNIEKGKNTKFLVSHFLSLDHKPVSQSLPFDVSNELLSSFSPSDKYRAVLRDVESKDGKKQFLEIWREQNLTQSVDLNALDVHGDVYTDGEFGTFQWFSDERKILYVAEKKIKKSEPFYKRKPSKAEGDTNDVVIGQEYIFRQDWGEQLVGKKQSVVAQYDIDTDLVKVFEGIPPDVCPAQPTWSPDGTYIVGVALKTEPRKLGLIYCANRPSTIFRLDQDGNYVELNLLNKCVKSPRFTPDNKYLIWLQRNAGGPHMSNMSLCRIPVPFDANTQVEVIVDFVDNETETLNGSKFYGLYNTSYPRRCWTNDGRLILSSPSKCSVNIYIINLNDKNVSDVSMENDSLVVLDVQNDIVIAALRNYLYPDKLIIGKVPPHSKNLKIDWTELTKSNILPGLENSMSTVMNLSQNTTDEVKNFTAIYVGPQTGAEKEVPLIVWPHGGPHSVFTNNLSLECSLFLSLGYGVLFVNYRGSLGYGKKNVEYLLGRVGTADVADCILATQEALVQFPWLDPGRLILVGGSHGGFLVTHLSGQYPDMFRAVVARNPVIDISAMSIISDIPDWCYVEAGSEYSQIGKPDDDILLAMRKASPIEHSHKVKAPTLLQVGSKDLRVPPSQATEHFYRLKANGIPVRMNLYDDNHPLGSIPNEMDNLINTVLWIEEHASK